MANNPPSQPNKPTPPQTGAASQGRPPAPQTQQEKDKAAEQAARTGPAQNPPPADRTATPAGQQARDPKAAAGPAKSRKPDGVNDAGEFSEGAAGPFGGHFPKQAASDVIAFLRGAGTWAQAWAGFLQLQSWAIEEFGPDQMEAAEPMKAGAMPIPHGTAVAAGGPDAHPQSLADALQQCSDTLTVADQPQRFAAMGPGAQAASLPPWFLTVLKAVLAFLESRKPNPTPA